MEIHIAKNIEHLCTVKKINKKTLGERIGVKPSSIFGYTSGKNYPSLEKTVAISSVFDVSLDALVLQDLTDPDVKGYKMYYPEEHAVYNKAADEAEEYRRTIEGMRKFLEKKFPGEYGAD